MDSRRRGKGGRPPAGEMRRVGRQIYFSPDELAHLQRQAAEVHQPVGRFVRLAALRHRLTVIPPVNRKAWSELARTAANLNQLAAAINSGRVMAVGSGVVELIEEQSRLVAQLRNALLGIGDDVDEGADA